LWSGFISPRIRTFVQKRFHSLFSKKKALKSGGVLSYLSFEAEVNFLRREKLSRRDYLDYFKNKAKSGDIADLEHMFRNVMLDKWSKKLILLLFVCEVDSFLPELEHLYKNDFTLSFPKRRL